MVTDPRAEPMTTGQNDRTQRERLLIDICNSALGFVVALVLLHSISLLLRYSLKALLSLVLVLPLIPATLSARRLAKLGRSRMGSYMLLTMAMLAMVANSWFVEGIFEVIAPALILIIIIAGLLLGPRGGFRFSLLAGILWVITRILLKNEMISPVAMPYPVAEAVVAAIVILSFVFVAVLSQVSTSELQLELDEATHELIAANERLEEASRLKSRFTARTSHELRSPLSAIVAFADLMLRNAYGPLTERQKDSLHRVMRSAKRLSTLIDDILDLSRLEAGELDFADERLDVADLWEAVHATTALLAEEKGIQLTCKISPNMPTSITGDERRLTQVLMNLTDNAIKYTDKGSVSVLMRPSNESIWEMVVEDTGRGISKENLENVFLEFRRDGGRPDVHSEQGTGLGLAITLHLVKAMGGHIEVRSEVERGSIFTVSLPLTRP